MSYNEKSEAITKEEWLQRLEQFPFKQADMNRLIMNYLVTGKQTAKQTKNENKREKQSFAIFRINYVCISNLTNYRGVQGGSRKVSA